MPTNTQDTTGCPLLTLEAGPHPDPEMVPFPKRRPLVFIPAMLTGLLLWLCYFPAAFGWLAWIALLPLLALVRTTGRHVSLAAYVGGLAFFVPALQWMRVADYRMYLTWIGLAVYCSIYFPLGIALLRLLDRRTRLPLVLTVPVVWTALEYLRSELGGGFAWYLLGYTQHDVLPMIQIADLAGVFGVSFLIAAVNAVLFEALCRLSSFRRWLVLPDEAVPGRLLLPASAVVVLLVATVAYGSWRLTQTEFAAGPTVALIQSNIDQRIKNKSTAGSEDANQSMFQHVGLLTDHACKGGRPIDLIVWPETSYPYDWTEVPADLPADQVPADLRQPLKNTQTAINDLSKLWKTNLLLGVSAVVVEQDRRKHAYNSAALLRPDKTLGGRYDKMHRVPFGEYVPLVEWLPFMNRFAPYDDVEYSVEAGKQWTSFALGQYRFGVIICYEDTDPDLAREYVKGDAPADFLVNISNDGWFDGTSEHPQHLAICRFRAIECRRSVVRSVNMGISALIDSNGRVRQTDQGYLAHPEGGGRAWNWKGIPGTAKPGRELEVSDWAEYVKAKGVLLTTVPIDTRGSVYASCGDWLPWSCWLLIGGSVLVGMVRPQRVVAGSDS